MKVHVDQDLCAGHGACVVTCPEVFRLSSDGYSESLRADIPKTLRDRAVQAAGECPERAITIDSERDE